MKIPTTRPTVYVLVYVVREVNLDAVDRDWYQIFFPSPLLVSPIEV